jgi:phosphatidylinositol alpha-1,6-mannosyltransferase
MNKRAYQNADLMIAVSNYTLQFARKNKLHPRNSCVIYNGADNMKFFPLDMPAIRHFKSQQQLHDEKIILTIGNVSERKGQQSVIQSLPIVLRSLPNVHYYCIGLPSEAERLIELAKDLNIQDHVHFLGKLPEAEVLRWLNASDIFAMTSVHTAADDFEGFGISVIEAALCKKPAIVTNNSSGVIESIVEGETGIGVADKGYQEIADAIIKLLTDKRYCTSMGDKAFDRAITQFTWEIQAGNYNSVLSPLLVG